ncbi:hypothetical protein QMZ25_17335 [Stenotrophomonas sp. RS-48]|uniref:hypothetical protein n=1 Tax=Stenotrophomonas sp. RS-48 TaxID=3043300 RepID=UPI0013127D58|nr:hypothetical protein [Stenotrophomonas sp. RS-48]MDI9250362.1 hypothetical protein [Stenotrophomonas sp. RS-48]
MSMNSSDFPLVWMDLAQGPEHEHQYDFDAFEENLRRGEPFVLLTDTAPSEEHDHSPAEKKRMALWMKQHKAELRRLVLAMVLVEPNPAKRVAYKTFSVPFSKFWGYPLHIVTSREKAIEVARNLLSQSNETP